MIKKLKFNPPPDSLASALRASQVYSTEVNVVAEKVDTADGIIVRAHEQNF